MHTEYNIGIKRITEVTACRTCGNNSVRETRKWGQHSNGHWNESVEFECGAKYEFTPNFMQVGLASICRQNREYDARKKLVEDVKAEIFALGEARGLHEEDLKKLKSNLQYWSVSSW